MIAWCTVPETWCTMDRQTDMQEKWHIEVGTPPKKCAHTGPILQIKAVFNIGQKGALFFEKKRAPNISAVPIQLFF